MSTVYLVTTMALFGIYFSLDQHRPDQCKHFVKCQLLIDFLYNVVFLDRFFIYIQHFD